MNSTANRIPATLAAHGARTCRAASVMAASDGPLTARPGKERAFGPRGLLIGHGPVLHSARQPSAYSSRSADGSMSGSRRMNVAGEQPEQAGNQRDQQRDLQRDRPRLRVDPDDLGRDLRAAHMASELGEQPCC